MKKLYSTIAIIGFIGSVQAQDFVISPSNTLDETLDIGVYKMSNINLAHDNTTTDSIEIQWEAFDVNIPAGWDFSYCDYTNCYAGNITSGTMSKIGENQTAFFKVNMMADAVGTGHIKVRVYKTGDQQNADTLTYNYNATLGLSDKELAASLDMYPNPSSGDELTIDGVLSNSTISITNSLGQVVLRRQYTGSNGKISFSGLNLRNGLYFVRFGRNNEIYSTRKLIVK